MAQAGSREVQILREWRGRIEAALRKVAPERGYFVNREELDRLWGAWAIPGDKPAVDFKTHMVLVKTCNCSHISITPLLDDKGDLNIQVTVTKDIRDDTAYIIVLIPRQGISMVKGKPL